MIKIAICDNEEEMCRLIEEHIHQVEVSGKLIWIHKFLSGEDLLKSMESGNSYHMIFLDYEMDGLNGGQVGSAVREIYRDETCLLIYVSSHPEMMAKLLDTEMYHFIEKPIIHKTFERIFLKACKRVTESKDIFLLKSGKEQIPIGKDGIYYLESEARKIKVVTEEGIYMMYGKLDEVANEFLYPGSNFVRIHKSFLINICHCEKVAGKKVLMKNGASMEMSKAYKSSFYETCMKHKGRNRL